MTARCSLHGPRRPYRMFESHRCCPECAEIDAAHEASIPARTPYRANQDHLRDCEVYACYLTGDEEHDRLAAAGDGARTAAGDRWLRGEDARYVGGLT